MSLWSDLLSETLRHADGDALTALQNLEVAALTGHLSDMSGPLLAYAERIGQAEDKVAGGADIARMSELLTLAQFGAGSMGSAVAAIYECAEAETGLESLFVSKFLTEIVLRRETCPALFPQDLLQRHDVGRQQLMETSARSALSEIVDRARETADRASIPDSAMSRPRLAKLIVYERKLLSKRLTKLSSNPCVAGPIDLGLWDRIATRISLRLRKRPSP